MLALMIVLIVVIGAIEVFGAPPPAAAPGPAVAVTPGPAVVTPPAPSISLPAGAMTSKYTKKTLAELDDPTALAMALKVRGAGAGTTTGLTGGTTGAGASATEPKLTLEQEKSELLKRRDAIIQKLTDESFAKLKSGQSIEDTYNSLNDIATLTGMDDKEKAKLMERYGFEASKQKVEILRSRPLFSELPEYAKILFKDEDSYNADLKKLVEARNTLAQKSVDPLLQVWEASSWDTLTKDQQNYFNGRSDFVQIQQNYVTRLSAAEQDFLIKRQAYTDSDAQLSQLRAKMNSEKDPTKRAELLTQVKGQEKAVKANFDEYSSMQPAALSAAYQRQAAALKDEIKRLDGEISTMPDGPERRAKERELATKSAQAQNLDFKAREATGQLTFAERLSGIVKAYNEYSGLGQFSSLFISDKDIAKRRQEAEDMFCNTVPLGGTQCWTSKICKSKIDPTAGGTSVVAQTATGEPRGAARVTVDKSPPAQYFNQTTGTMQTQFLYRTSYFIQNPTDSNLTYNIIFYATDGTTYRAFDLDKQIRSGASESRMRSTSVARYSDKDYRKACLTFKPGIKKWDGGLARELCTSVASYAGEATSLPNAPTQPGTTGGSGAGTTSYQPRADFEGF